MCCSTSVFVTFHLQHADVFLISAEVKTEVLPTSYTLALRAVPAALVGDLGGSVGSGSRSPCQRNLGFGLHLVVRLASPGAIGSTGI